MEENFQNYKNVLEKLVDILKTESASEGVCGAATPTDLLHKLIGMASDAGLDDIKERIIDG
jgi:hypothetical protein